MADRFVIIKRDQPPAIKPIYDDVAEAAAALDYLRKANPDLSLALVRLRDQQEVVVEPIAPPVRTNVSTVADAPIARSS